MTLKNYETVFILTPVLSEAQTKDTVEKFVKVLEKNNAEIINVESWGLKKLAYPIQHKSTGSYHFVEFKATPDTIAAFETEFRRDETVMRFLTTVLDKHALAFSEKRRAGMFNKKKEETK
ncbi:30S ribosomal protein S6 [Aureibacter tunicatorum]|uniref:Small ribosomal subunit protein bS6 n=1 Tax=Aureibacter tunicatorum TaxID=866807 RepID=A0AAE3XNH5_9BACT|nr:30S ribosomal protein S6 [Aureibacter tunicatorum]MDR6239130.1 small subunit ribosomal protein S6 [Aureibacter tunicatorum]BDD04944.1 30S ribosomal protein S6 [Aureibacter tunicatorum]